MTENVRVDVFNETVGEVTAASVKALFILFALAVVTTAPLIVGTPKE